MLKVIDFNAIASNPRPLEEFFAASPENVAVLTDMMGIECLKRAGAANFRKSFQHFSKHSHRVLVLKPFVSLSKLRPQKRGFLERLVDKELTSRFPEYCHQMLAGSDPRIVGTIETEQTKVQVFFEKAEKLVDKELRASISEYKKAIPPSKLAEWRKSKPLSNEQLNFAHSMIAGITERHYEQLFPNDPLPNSEDALYWIPFRHSVALQALTLKWIRDDGHLAAKVATLRNDSIDMFYVAYGTIFDGVLSSDSKLLELCVLADTILRYAYGLSRTAP